MFIDAILARDKKPIEEFRLAWDFTNDVESGDTLATPTTTAKEVQTGADVSGTFLQGAAISGLKSVVQVQGGDDTKDYIVTFKVQTTQGDIFERSVLVHVRA